MCILCLFSPPFFCIYRCASVDSRSISLSHIFSHSLPVFLRSRRSFISASVAPPILRPIGFGDPQLMQIDVDSGRRRTSTKALARHHHRHALFAHHEKAKSRVNNSLRKQGHCQVVRKHLHKCLLRSSSTTS